MIRLGTRTPRNLRHGSRQVHLLSLGGDAVYASPEVENWALRKWLADNAVTTAVMTTDSTAQWLELDVTLPADFTGSPETGFVGSVEICAPPMRLGLSWSNNLTEWVSGGWIQSPDAYPLTLPDGRKQWRARYYAPGYYRETLIDYTLSSDRYGKSVTGLNICGEDIALSGFPFALPAESARFQGALRTYGFTGATVTSSPAALVATAKNHTPSGSILLRITMSGTNVTDVTYQGSTIPLSYPFSLPTQRAALQSALRSAGYDGAVVMLHESTWALNVPNRLAFTQVRQINVTLSPGDPFPVWDFSGNYTGENPATVVAGEYSNVRSPDGSPLSESNKGFARLGFIPI